MTQIAFLGGGNMAAAIIHGMLKKDFKPEHISVIKRNILQGDLAEQFGISVFDALDKVPEPDVWVLAVKPQDMQVALTQLAPLLKPHQMLISIAAGLTIQTLSQWAQHNKIARTMPNTPSLVGQGMTGIYAPAPLFSADEQALIEHIFSAVGQTVWLNAENDINTIIAISGSGPAYVFYMMEHLTAAAINLGLDAAAAQSLVKATFTGAAALANASADDFATLRQKVTSKGGTTAAAIATFEAHQMGEALQAGAHAAALRAVEMSIELAKSNG